MAPNRLIQEKSPYLQQHAHNPVDWFPWGEEAFAKAASEDKPVFLSVGYSTCHWCHVMERESFENEAVAEILNREFVSIKVDREERPDVDRIYMLFVQATTGSGGWPMSVWLTPDRKPFFGGTYFPPDRRYGRPGFASILEQLAHIWKTQREKALATGESLLAELREQSAEQGSPLAGDPLERTYHYFRRTFDAKRGGFGGAPKFPRPSVFDFLFRYFRRTGEEEARDMALFTLREMAKGGMYDHIGGGFHRYSVDERWHVPHFEKMLYDQAQLAASYLEAFQITGEAGYAETARGVLDYVLRDMTHPEGGFYSAEDADSAADPARPHEKGEGVFYVWRQNEIEEILGADAAASFCHRYGCRSNGNVDPAHDPHGEFTGRNILFLSQRDGGADLAEARALLLEARNGRPRPHLDDKILASWNGLMISAFARAARVLDEPRYEEAAARAACFVLREMFDPAKGSLKRRWREGEAAIDGFLDDYASMVRALIDLYETTFDTAWLEFARRLAACMVERCEDRERGGFFSAPEAADLVLRLKDDYDGAEPSGNSLAVEALARLAAYTGEQLFAQAAGRALDAFAPRLAAQGPAMPLMLVEWMRRQTPRAQVVITGEWNDPGLKALLTAWRKRYRPLDAIFACRSAEDRARLNAWRPELAPLFAAARVPTAFVCENFTCQAPVTTAETLADLLQ